ncbi:MAG: hypothetical protein H0X34_10080 [Chthoniobacterales bacterium]|nr:hypothetical protein [Chthoniobacterales bacterium]
MTPRRFLNFFRSPTGALTLFLLGLLIVLVLVNSRRPAHERVSLVPKQLQTKDRDKAPQVPETIRRKGAGRRPFEEAFFSCNCVDPRKQWHLARRA